MTITYQTGRQSAPSRLAQPHTEPRATLFGDFLVLALPLLGLIQIDLVGKLFIHEIVLLVLLPVLILKRGRLMLSNRSIGLIFLLGVLWFISQVITDLYRETPAVDFLRGWAKISLFLICYLALFLLITTPARVVLWLSALVVPMLVRPFQLFDNSFDLYIFWKFGMGYAVLLLLCLPFLWRVRRGKKVTASIHWVALVHLVFGFGSFFLNARSLAGISILAGALVFLYGIFRGYHMSQRKVIMGLAGSLATGYLLLAGYSVGAGSGFFGDQAQEKHEIQNFYQTGPLSILLGGRSEAMVSTIAIADSPILGHGSWAKDFRYVALLYELRQQYSDEPGAIDPDAPDLIPSHSYLFGAWVEAGLAGGLFWIVILIWCFTRVIPAAFLEGHVLGLCVLLVLPLFIWNILFSPFGATERVDAAATLAICTLTIHLARFSNQRPGRQAVR